MTHFFFQPFDKFIKLAEFLRKSIKKCCSGDRVIDLLLHFPTSIQNRSGNIRNFSDKLTIVARIIDHRTPRSRTSPYKVIAQTAEGDL
ncbi:MAG: hypothetical protein LBO02_02335 [Holosporaceae bacterium]|jgi:hypothetical protein|nr:hypothetical protein [Holosporaceae bacterium]